MASTSPSANTPWRSPISELRYTAYGEERYASGETPTGYRYTGQLSKMDATGLYYYGARWYDPYLNRFLSPDSIIPDPYNPLDWDRYSYVNNNPIKYNDPSGHDKCTGTQEFLPDCEIINGEWTREWSVGEDDPYWNGDLQTQQDFAAIKEGVDFVGSIVSEPYDWYLTGKECINGDCSPWVILGMVPLIPGSLGDEIGEGLIRLVRKDQIGTSQPFKLRKGEDGISVFEGVSSQEVLDVFPGNEVPNTTVTIPKDKLPKGTQIIPKLDPRLPQRLSEAHRILVRPEGWSIDRFAKAFKEILGW